MKKHITLSIYKNFNIFLVVLLCLLSYSSLYTQTSRDSSYFPLAIGNKWIYKPVGFPGADTVTVVDMQRVASNLYYAIKENSNQYFWFRIENEKLYIIDTAAVRLDSLSSLKEYLVYDFSAAVGDSWDVPLKNDLLVCKYSGKIVLKSKNESVVTDTETFNNCILFSGGGSQCRDAGYTRVYFAPGVGKISYYEGNFTGVRKFVLSYSNLITDVPGKGNLQSIREYNLYQNYPNPFNPITVISYQLPVRSNVELKVYDVLGREIMTLVNEEKQPGNYKVQFNGMNLSNGIYFYRLTASSDRTGERFVKADKMMLLK